MKNIVRLLFLLVITYSCQKENSTEEMNISTTIDFYMLDNLGNDLLNPTYQNSLAINSIKIYYMVNGNQVAYNEPDLDHPKGFLILQPEGSYEKYRFRLFPNILESEGSLTTTYIKWNDSETDVVKTQLNIGDSYIICTKIWYNDIIVWDNSGERFFELLK